jgi:hypothetical protein
MRSSVVRGLVAGLLVALAGCDGGGGDGGGGDGGGGDGGGCTAPMVWCPGAGCVNTSVSVDHCGDCAAACEGCDRCIMGDCTPACCGSDEIDCDPSVATLDCVVTTNNRAHCGSCDNVCADDETCSGRQCVPCEAPLARCGNTCADLSNDIRHCGECDNACERMYCQCGDCVPERTDAGCG